ncbi:hypothetical protein PC117_g22866 [Phytophthora cactorum]|uniref:Uncharacterized protein n=1 Tax=Phytophthora cactorum TaxID=29920 RepID=A0A8T1BBR3_9STRA|nr:hypothetical protein PC117_g22866 [Phytophthora cactorum]
MKSVVVFREDGEIEYVVENAYHPIMDAHAAALKRNAEVIFLYDGRPQFEPRRPPAMTTYPKPKMIRFSSPNKTWFRKVSKNVQHHLMVVECELSTTRPPAPRARYCRICSFSSPFKRENRFFCILPGLQDASLGCAIRPCCIVAFRVVNHSYHTTESDLACDRLRGALVATCATALVSAALLSPDALLDLGAGYAIRSFSSAT